MEIEVRNVLPKELYLIVVKYMGDIKFWKYTFIGCLFEIDQIVRLDDNMVSYYQRTGIRHSGIYRGETNEELSIFDYPLHNEDELYKKDTNRDNIILEILESYFPEYDYQYVETHPWCSLIGKLIYEYVGWIYSYRYELN